MPLISIIMPVYNAKDTLIKAVGSLVNQTLSDIEIILVNDASTDNSFTIMQLLEERFPDKIAIINSDVNQGPGGARNIGLSYARGEYIGFMDSDDIAEATMYEKLYNKAVSEDFDIVDCGFFNEKDNMAIIYTSDDLCGKLTPEKRNKLIVSGGYLWSKIYKKSFLSSIDFTFRHNCILEDADTLTLALATAKSIGNVKEILYIYKDYSTSSSKLVEPFGYYNNCFKAMKAIYEKLSPLEIYPDIKMSVEYEMLQMYSYAVNCLFLNKERIDKSLILQLLSDIREFRLNNISEGYDNVYVQNKISPDNITAMILNDKSPNKLFNHKF